MFTRRSGLLRSLLPAQKPSPWSVPNDSPPQHGAITLGAGTGNGLPCNRRPVRRIERGVVEGSIAGVTVWAR